MAEPNTYDIGDVVVLHARFTRDGTPVDPTGVSFQVRRPDGTISTIPGVDDTLEVGHWTADVDVDQAGPWYYKAVGTGAAQATEQASFHVRRDLVTTP